MKKFIHKFRSDVKGSVSIFFIIIIVPIFLFNAVLIDYARILAADKQSEYAIQSAVRSAMASYDSDLREFGLFGVKKEDVDYFEEILRANLQTVDLSEESIVLNNNSGAFQFIDPKVEDFNLDLDRELAHPEILRHQILEEMKYKAPVEIIKELLEKFNFISKAMKETSTFINTVSEIEKDFDKREQKLDDIRFPIELKEPLEGPNHLVKAQDALEVIQKDLSKTSSASFPTVNSLNDIISNYNRYEEAKKEKESLESLKDALEQDKRQQENKLREVKNREINEEDEDEQKKKEDEKEEEIKELEEAIEDLEDQINSMETQISALDRNIKRFETNAAKKMNELSSQSKTALDHLQDAKRKLDLAKKNNDKIIQEIRKGRNTANNNYEGAIFESEKVEPSSEVDKGELANVEKTLDDLSKELDEYKYETSFFTTIGNHLDNAITSVISVNNSLNTDISGDLSSAKKSIEDQLPSAKSSVDSAIEYMKTHRRDYEEGDMSDFDDYEIIDNDGKHGEAEQSIDTSEDINSLRHKYDEEKAIYEDLTKTIGELQRFLEDNDLMDGYFEDDPNNKHIGDSPELDFGEDATASSKDAMRLVDALFSGIGNFLLDARDELYINEYILMNFESAKPGGKAEDFLYENREVEYILYGLPEVGANYTAALSQLFAIRFALRFIDAFTVPWVRAAGHPIAVFVAALGYALKYSSEDMNGLQRGGSAELIGENLTGRLEFGYNDYVRLFLFMNPGGDNRLMRVMSVINEKSGIDLTQNYTYAHGSVDTSVQLWFIPEIAKAMEVVSVIDGKVNNNRYEFNKEAYFSY
ncbi:hypothetical protein [Halalkalibacter alkaliphilus]|uniref:Uncharacterized protein n=1 Tax=Halalkalibacter alkaliphilus TaxID=2917993 RepID=A0A9X2I6X3_9BACI|nr:hypothetical protein [Halalkalibacter alkaliphilus]MCL7748014.1 hypothetical protein [Halalkalibacter alkaliphilus]